MALVFIIGIVWTSFFTIFKLKFSDYLQLNVNHTDCVTFCSFTGLCSKLIAVACFNFMVIVGEVQLRIDHDNDSSERYFETSFIDFYKSMI